GPPRRPTSGPNPADPVENTSDPLHARLLGLALPVLFVALGANSIWDANEAFYVETPRQMVLSGDYLTPSFNDAHRLNKPVLNYWIVAGLYQAFGISVEVERVGIAIGAAAIVFATFLVGRALSSTATGILAALVVITAPRFVFWSRRIFIDIYITMFMAVALSAFVLAERHPERRRRYLMLMWVAIGLGTLTKGPVALVLPAVVAGLWLLAERRLADLRRMMIVPGLAVVAAIVAPWYVALYLEHGWEPVHAFFVGENVGRFTSAMASDRRGPLFYVPVLLTDLFPWAPLVIVPLVVGALSVLGRTTPAAMSATGRLLWWWIVVIVGAFSLSETKQDLYIFPVVPAVAALVANALLRPAGDRAGRAMTFVLAGTGVLTVVAAIVVWRYFGPGGGPWRLAGVGWAAGLLLGAGLGALAGLWRGRRPLAILALATGFAAFNYVLATVVLPDIERFKPVPAIARTFAERASPGARLAQLDQALPSLVYYADHAVEDLPSLSAAADALAGPDEIWILVPEGHAETLTSQVPESCVTLRHPVFDLTPRQAFDGVKPPEVVLLSNRCGRSD
ncbi:MAG TPA: glycosyltransferase family 39 protein, partial [Vicinamibacterales bacterium]|nr:glycosyltransferase family 39 protein [Vicinamibacterales bacterium]